MNYNWFRAKGQWILYLFIYTGCTIGLAFIKWYYGVIMAGIFFIMLTALFFIKPNPKHGGGYIQEK